MRTQSIAILVLVSISIAALGCASNAGVEADGLVQYQGGVPVQPWSETNNGPPAGPDTVTGPQVEQPVANPAVEQPQDNMPVIEQPVDNMPPAPTPTNPQPQIDPMLPMAGSEAPPEQPEPEPMMPEPEPEPEPVVLATKVVVDVTSKTQGGRYAPRNVGAIWVENSQGAWVKTLAVWAWIRGRHLHRYLQANPTNNTVDAVTSATLRTHENHKLEWDLTDASGADVPDGEYSIFIEVTEKSSAGEFTSVSFTKGGEPSTATFSGPFEGSISYE